MAKGNRNRKSPVPEPATIKPQSQSLAAAVGSPGLSGAGVDVSGIDPELLKSYKIETVQLDALVVMKIIKHSKEKYPVTATGQLLGLEIKGTLQVTNCFPFMEVDESTEADGADYQLQMLRSMRRLNYDANTVGWYQSTYLGSFWNQNFIETQYNYQKTFGDAIVIVYDPSRTAQGNLCLKAFRLTENFMNLYKDKKFTQETIHKHGLTPSSIVESIPIKIKNSQLLNVLMHEIGEEGYDHLELGLENYLEKHLEYLGDTIDEHGQEQYKWHWWQRNFQKEQVKQLHLLKDCENVEEMLELNPVLNKLKQQEPARLETLIIANQIDTYCKQVNQFSGPGLTKMYLFDSLQN